jgi:hypothetical protein
MQLSAHFAVFLHRYRLESDDSKYYRIVSGPTRDRELPCFYCDGQIIGA